MDSWHKLVVYALDVGVYHAKAGVSSGFYVFYLQVWPNVVGDCQQLVDLRATVLSTFRAKCYHDWGVHVCFLELSTTFPLIMLVHPCPFFLEQSPLNIKYTKYPKRNNNPNYGNLYVPHFQSSWLDTFWRNKLFHCPNNLRRGFFWAGPLNRT